MNQQEQATKRAAIFQDTINGTNDPTPWPVTMWASSGDTIWTAGTARTAGEDSVGMIYGPGDTIVHRNTIAGDTTRATESSDQRTGKARWTRCSRASNNGTTAIPTGGTP